MRTHYLTVGLTLLLLTGAVVAADTKTQKVHCKGGGTFTDGVETNIDTDGDGDSAADRSRGRDLQLRQFCLPGRGGMDSPTNLTTCPAGTTDEYHIDATQGQHRSVATDEKTGDQLFGQVTSGTLCIDFSSCPTLPFPFTTSGHAESIGGTGKYTDATGTVSFHSVGSYLQYGFKGGTGAFGAFGQFTSTADGTLTLPKGGKDKED